jgi:hypothetical protein
MSLVKSSQTHYFTHSMNKHDTMSWQTSIKVQWGTDCS